MSCLAKAALAFMSLALLAALCALPAPAFADDQCSGTLCDLFAKPSTASKSATPSAVPAKPEGTPLTVPTLSMPTSGGLLNFFKSSSSDTPAAAAPSSQQAASAPFVRIEGGRKEERCSGTFCDVYYGTIGSKSSEQQATATPVSTGPATEAQYAVKRKEIAEQQVKPRCVAPASDPWRCYR